MTEQWEQNASKLLNPVFTPEQLAEFRAITQERTIPVAIDIAKPSDMIVSEHSQPKRETITLKGKKHGKRSQGKQGQDK